MQTYRILCATLAFVAFDAAGQSVIETPSEIVEVIGLRRWTIPMLQDSLAKYAPGTNLSSSSCAVTLRYKLGFADAASITYMGMEAKQRRVVMLVEPQDSLRVRYRPVSLDTIAAIPDYRDAIALLKKHPNVVRAAFDGVREWRRIPGRAMRHAGERSDSAAVVAFWRFLDERRDEHHLTHALKVMAADSNVYNRTIAVAIAGNFLDRDSTLWALVEVIRESEGGAKGTAAALLNTYAQDDPRLVDWSGAAPTLRLILNGTSLFHVDAVMAFLERTGIDSTMAAPLLAGGGETVLDFLGSQTPYLRSAAHDLLIALRGSDLGEDPEAWRAWISSL